MERPQVLKTPTLKTPAAQGYVMPAEWELHAATWLSWPHNKETWPGHRMKEVEENYLQMLAALLPGEKVHLLVESEKEASYVQKALQKRDIGNANLVLHLWPAVDSWIRDYGPTFVKKLSGEKAWCKWIFNAWGGKYPSLAEDTHIFQKYQQKIPYPCFEVGIILEGGSIEVNGAGTCITTEQCLLNSNRNANLSRTQIENLLKDYLGVTQVLWLGEGIVGDDTDGHIDDIVRFVDANTLISAYEENQNDENYHFLNENWKRLQSASDAKGKKLKTIKFPMPAKVIEEGVRLPASYANFYIANQCVLVPVYDFPQDKRACDMLKEFFPKREIIPVKSRSLVYGLGAIHCVTQQEPA